mmetsp:Transcript_1308/g.1656  ORF Transcript_1308/g.1656 Transcript_1308/m.1656 type:complete len:98 (-) Transcript_1308:318-611(-)
MQDFEIRQAFAIIQDRVDEIKKDQDWKEKIADEWNEAAKQEEHMFGPVDNEATKSKGQAADQRSVFSYRSEKLSQRSKRSQAPSMASRIAAEKQKEA